ncbi:MAG: hypothetical protein [Caudoviricetes sp.]|nr:MAG: hypothetical protein [Caudoviricetes sp.]
MATSTLPITTTTPSTVVDISTQLKKYGYSRELNSLDNYDNVTYHITFSMLTDIPNSTKKIIISESGATELSIRYLDMNQSVGPNEQDKNINLCALHMTIFDPYGIDIYDKLQASAIELQLNDYNNAVFLLEIRYMGYDSVTGSYETDIYGRTSIKCIITEIRSTVTVGGSEHSLDLVEVNNVGSMDDYMLIDRSIIIQPESSKLGDVLNSLSQQLNDTIKQNYNGIDMVTYKFADETYPTRYIKDGVVRPFDLITTISDDSLTESQRNPNEVNAPKTSSIQDIITQLLSNSSTAIKLLGNQNSDQLTFDPDSIYGIGHKIIVSVQYGIWNSLYNKYKKTITYKIVPFLHYNIYNSPQNIENTSTTELTMKKFQDICNYGELKKEYNYQYTGKNTEILNFEIKTTMYYQFLFLPSMANVSYSNVTSKAGIDNLKTRLTDNTNTINILKKQNIDLNKKLQQTPDDSNISTQITSNNNRIDQLVNENKQIASQGNDLDEETYKTKSQFISSLSPSTYVDDLDVSKISSSFNIIKPSSQLTNMVNPITNSGFLETTKDNNQGIYSALLSQYWGSTTDALQAVNIDIRLDPYWISGKNNNQTKEITAISNEDYGIQNYFKDGFCHFLLNYQIPNGVDETTGELKLNLSDLYSGVYQVISVLSKFEEGKMIQTLTANKLCTLTLGKILSGTSMGKIGINNTSDMAVSNITNNYLNSTSNKNDEWENNNNNSSSVISVNNNTNTNQKNYLNNLIEYVR